MTPDHAIGDAVHLAADTDSVHVFDPDTRDYYKLEELWADAPRIDWEREVD